MADKMQHQKTGLEKATPSQQNRHKPGELGAKDPSGKLGARFRVSRKGSTRVDRAMPSTSNNRTG